MASASRESSQRSRITSHAAPANRTAATAAVVLPSSPPLALALARFNAATLMMKFASSAGVMGVGAVRPLLLPLPPPEPPPRRRASAAFARCRAATPASSARFSRLSASMRNSSARCANSSRRRRRAEVASASERRRSTSARREPASRPATGSPTARISMAGTESRKSPSSNLVSISRRHE